MDLYDFVRDLDQFAFRSLMDACVTRVSENIKDIPVLTDAERVLAGVSRVKATKCVMDRTGMNLGKAKDSVDREVPRELDEPRVTIVRKPDYNL